MPVDPFPAPLWGVVRFEDATLRPVCWLCGWTGPELPYVDDAREELDGHMVSDGHMALLDTFTELTNRLD